MADSILDPPPSAVVADLRALAGVLEEVPAKQLDRNLLIATWNIREFGRLAEVWDQKPGVKPFRDLHALRLIGEIVARFDVVAIQEAQKDTAALRNLLRWLGPDWGLILSDVTRGARAGSERLAFVFDTRRVRPAGLACELVLSPEDLELKDPKALRQQFARTPYAVAFSSHGVAFALVTVHIVWGHGEADRTPEITGIARWLKRWAADVKDDFNQNMIALGDFNIGARGDANHEALLSTGLTTPPELDKLSRTLAKDDDAGTFYDQIAWFPERFSLRYGARAGRVKWKGAVLKHIAGDEITYRISDHYPLWVEFLVGELPAR